MKDITEKLNMLKSVQPTEKWVLETRQEVLSKAPVVFGLENSYNDKSESAFNLSNLFAKNMVVTFTAIVFVLVGLSSASYSSRLSLPGDALYSVKMASESIELAVSSKENRAEIEIKQAGKRLEELAEISKNTSDFEQGEKAKQLVASFEEKVNNAQDVLANIQDEKAKAKVAKVIHIQTEKYTEVLATVNESLPEVVKNDVSDNLASATDSNKKVNLDSLAIRVEVMTDSDKEEITAIVKEKIDQQEIVDLNAEDETETSEDTLENNSEDIIVEDETETSEDTPENNPEDETVDEQDNSTEETETSEDIQEITIEETKIELLKDIDSLNNPDNEENPSDEVDSDIETELETEEDENDEETESTEETKNNPNNEENL